MQSAVTGGFFHHAAMVLKERFDDNKDDVFLYEAVGNGVICGSWKENKCEIGPGKKIEMICVRKLICNRDKEFMDKAIVFMGEALNHKYSLKSLFNRHKKSEVGALEPENDFSPMYVEKDRPFFCSELVVKAYKILGVLNNEESSSSFLPSNLENNDAL
jgi:hypothetical protein